MKAFFLLALLCFPALALIPQENELEACVSSLEASRARLLGYLPAEMIAWDRNLAQRTRGILDQRENLTLLQQQLPRQISVHDRHLLYNAIDGCNEFKAEWHEAVRWYLMRAGGVALLALLLTGYFAFQVVRRG